MGEEKKNKRAVFKLKAAQDWTQSVKTWNAVPDTYIKKYSSGVLWLFESTYYVNSYSPS